MYTTKSYPENKVKYFTSLEKLVATYSKILIVEADHVGSRQMAEIRYELRGKAVVSMGKNTMIRTLLRSMLPKNIELQSLIPCIKRNVGLIFCESDPVEIRKIILNNKVAAPARQGAFAPVDVVVPAGPTSLDPSQTSFFQVLGIPTKLVKGQIEIQNDVNLIKTGDKVTASQASLLKKLNIFPFSYNLKVLQIFDNGSVYNADVLDITDSDIINKFRKGVTNVAAFSRMVGLPNEVSVPHAIIQGFKYCASLGLETNMIFKEIATIKNLLDNPDALRASIENASKTEKNSQPIEKVDPTPVEEDDEEEDGDFGFDLFG